MQLSRGSFSHSFGVAMGPALLLAAAVFLGTCSTHAAVSDELTWWNIERFLREFVNEGLGANKLQDYLDNEFEWKNREVDGRETLNKIRSSAVTLFQATINNLRNLKATVEAVYTDWPAFTRQNISDSEFCCGTDEPPRTGCAVLATRLDPGAAVRAVRPPDPVLRQLQRIPKFTTKTTHYIALEDGSLFMHPPKSKDKLLVCDDYEFRSRYFYTQSKSPEPRSVVVVVDGGMERDPLLEHAVNKVYNELSPIDRIGLCLPDSNSCRTVVWKRDRFPHGCTWPREDGPLGQTTFLGRLLFNNKGNRAKLSEILKNFGEYAAFSDQASALKAGSDLLKKQNESQYLQIAGQPHSVLVYVTKRGDWEKWRDDDALVKQLDASLDLGISIVINHLYGVPQGVKRGVIMEKNGATVTFSPIKDNGELYASETEIPSYGLEDGSRPVIPIPYYDAFGDGYIITVCMTLMHNRSFVGTVCSDLSIINLLEAVINVDDIEGGYVFIVDRLGRALKHPLLPAPHSVTVDPTYVTIDKLEISPGVRHILDKAVRQETGNETVKGLYVESLGYPRGINIPSAMRVRHRTLQYLWAPINETDLAIVVVLPVNENGQVTSTEYSCKSPKACETSHFEYNEPRNNVSRTFCKFVGISVVKGEGLVKFAPDCFIDVLSYVRGEIDPAKVYAIFNGTLPHDEVLREDLRPSVKFLEEAEEAWKSNLNLSNYIGTRFMGTEDGSFISFPGIQLNQIFDHRDLPWYQTALSNTEPSSISMTTPYYSELGLGLVCTVSKALHDNRGNPQAVVAGDFTLQYIMTHFLNQVPYCKRHTCLLVDHLGFVVLKSDWAIHQTPKWFKDTDIIGSHINRVAADIARDLIARKYLMRRACHEYERSLTYYSWSLAFPGFRTWHEGPNYGIYKIVSTNLFLAYRTEGRAITPCNCDPYQRGDQVKCHGTCEMECECPCVAGPDTIPCHTSDADLHKYPLPACKPRYLITARATDDSSSIPACVDFDCSVRNKTDCSNVIWCLWSEEKCQNVDS